MLHDVSVLCEEVELEAQMFSLAKLFIRIPNVQFSTETAFLPNSFSGSLFLFRCFSPVINIFLSNNFFRFPMS